MKTTTKLREPRGEPWTQSVSVSDMTLHSVIAEEKKKLQQSNTVHNHRLKNYEKQILIVSFRTGNELFHLILCVCCFRLSSINGLKPYTHNGDVAANQAAKYNSKNNV